MVEEIRGDPKCDGATDVTQTERYSRYRCDELVRASNLRNDRRWNDDATDPKGRHSDYTVHGWEIMWRGDRYCADTSSHDRGEEEEQQADTPLSDWDKYQTDRSADDDAKSDGKRSNTNANWIVTFGLLAETLCRLHSFAYHKRCRFG